MFGSKEDLEQISIPLRLSKTVVCFTKATSPRFSATHLRGTGHWAKPSWSTHAVSLSVKWIQEYLVVHSIGQDLELPKSQNRTWELPPPRSAVPEGCWRRCGGRSRHLYKPRKGFWDCCLWDHAPGLLLPGHSYSRRNLPPLWEKECQAQ